MANYNAQSRTNYFRVNDEEKYQNWFSKLLAEDNILDFSEDRSDEGDGIFHGFGAYSDIIFECEDENGDYYNLLEELQELLPEDEAFIYTEVGCENLRYLVGLSIIVTKHDIKAINLSNEAVKTARDMLGDSEKKFKLEY